MQETPPTGGAPENQPRPSRAEDRLSGRAQRKIAAEQAAKRRKIMVAAGVVLAAAAIALIAFFFTRQPAVAPVAVAPTLEQDIQVAGRTMGDPNAPVKVVEWGDYQ